MSDYKQLKIEFNKPSFKDEISETLGNRCANCDSELDIEYHHIIPLALGGTNRITNIVPLCYVCHQIAHGSRNIRRICRAENTGRPRAPLPDNYEDILWQYFHGEIGRVECESLFNMGKASKLTDRLFFKEFVEANNIKSFVNKVDMYKRFPERKRIGSILAKVVYTNGKEDTRYVS